jgi:hypothetical protein
MNIVLSLYPLIDGSECTQLVIGCNLVFLPQTNGTSAKSAATEATAKFPDDTLVERVSNAMMYERTKVKSAARRINP